MYVCVWLHTVKALWTQGQPLPDLEWNMWESLDSLEPQLLSHFAAYWCDGEGEHTETQVQCEAGEMALAASSTRYTDLRVGLAGREKVLNLAPRVAHLNDHSKCCTCV